MLFQENWIFEFEAFDGAWSLADCAGPAANGDRRAIVSVAHLLVVRVVANAVRRQIRSEDLHEEIACTRGYLEEMTLTAPDQRVFGRLLDSLTPFDPEQVTEALLSACVAARDEGRAGAARGLAELAYEGAAAFRLDASAQGAALALAHLAGEHEAPWSARKWRAIARLHARRIRTGRFAAS